MKGFEQYEGHTDKREKYLIHLFAFSLLTLSQVECNIHESRALSVFFLWLYLQHLGQRHIQIRCLIFDDLMNKNALNLTP